MSKLVITRGLPGSGKTTYARAWVLEDPVHRVRVNRDDLRMNLFGRKVGLEYAQEEVLTMVQHNMVRGLLDTCDVIVDDTNLRLKHARAWANLARERGAEFYCADFPESVELCITRQVARPEGDRVPESVIRTMHEKFPPRNWKPVVADNDAREVDPYTYVPNQLKRPAWMFDIDGTLAQMTGRGPFEWHRVGEDALIEAVAELNWALAESMRNQEIVLMSGRDESCRAQTEAWLHDNHIYWQELFMRPAGDYRKDSVVKLELFREHVAPNYNVLGVFDDRDQVVEMWRRIGLPCFQVAPGNF